MDKLKVIIVEDDLTTAKTLEEQIISIDPGASVIAILSSVVQATEWLSKNSPDLIFMDIQLGENLSFEIFENTSISSPVIFTTAYDQFALKAFKANGIDYLIKPICIADLEAALKKFRSLGKKETDIAFIKSLFSGASHNTEYKKRFIVQSGNSIRSIPTEDIAYFYFLEKSVFFYTTDNHRHSTEYSLNKLKEMVNPDIFFRINRHMLVSFKSIETMSMLSKSRMKLRLSPPFDQDVLVSFNKTHLFRNWLNKTH